MCLAIFKFEVQHQLKQPETYLFFLFLFLFSVFGVEFVFQGVELGLVKKNAPIVIAKTMAALTGLSMLIGSIMMSRPILRDFQQGIAPLIFINPISKRDYLAGKFLAGLALLCLVFSAVLWGTMLGALMPWINPEEYGPFAFLNYLQAFTWVALPIVLFTGALFFVTAALSKSLMLVYTQGLIVFTLFILTKSINHEVLQAILDPLSLSTLSFLNQDWSVEENNTLFIPYHGVLLWNKCFWLFIGLVAMIFGYRQFELKTIPTKASKKKQTKSPQKSIATFNESWPTITPLFNAKAQLVQLLSGAWFHAQYILKQSLFWAILISAVLIIMINSINLGSTYHVDSYPTTFLIVAELLEMAIYFFIAILLIYTGEIMWKEKQARLHFIYDATPVTNFTRLLSKFLGLCIVYVILLFALTLSGLIFQMTQGYFHFNLEVYFTGFFLELLPFLMLYTMIALFFQALIGHKFMGLIATLAFFIANVAFSIFFTDHVLLNFGGHVLAPYSEMNRYGHFLFPYLLEKAYWLAFGMLLLIIASIVMPRGMCNKLSLRWASGFRQINPSLIKFALISLLITLSLGAFIFYNTNILNEYWSKEEQSAFRAQYERSLKPFEAIQQPKIVAANLNIELFPSQRAYEIKGTYQLINPYANPIKEIHIQKRIATDVSLHQLRFDRPVKSSQAFDAFHYTIYELANPLQQGDTLLMTFEQHAKPKGFENKDQSARFLQNGTFFDNNELPSFAYNSDYELQEEDLRKDYQLPPKKGKANIDDEQALRDARTGSDSDGLQLEIIIGTEKPQTAVTSGKLLRKWSSHNRNYFHYKSNQAIINFYSIVSANYAIKKDRFIPAGHRPSDRVDLEIYYHPGHAYNLDRMFESMKRSLDYFSTQFGPYPYAQIRIMEFPRYREFAQSFPTAIPFSEATGFLMDIDDDDVDMVFFITAHELAHQWWGIQLEAANVKGRNMILETLAQYSAMMVLKNKYPTEKLNQFLQQQLEDYLKGQRKQKKAEPPLNLVENEAHIYYAKGALNMYALQKHIGEDKVNTALQNFLKDWKTFNNPNKADRYATTQDLIKYFRAQTPEHLQFVITDLFEQVKEIDASFLGIEK